MKKSSKEKKLPSDSDFRLIFKAVPDPCLVLDPDLRIVEVNDAYLRATMTKRDEIIGRGMFEVFPDNPAVPNATGVRNLSASLNRVLQKRVADVMAVQKYDIRKPEEGEGFEERYWSPINTPVVGEDGEIDYIIHRVEDVTDFVHIKQKEIEEHKLNEELRERAVRMEAEIFAKSQQIAEVNLEFKKANEELESRSYRLLEANEKLRELNSRLEMEAAERIRAQKAVDAVNADLQRSNKELELFASVASHDLQEPLLTISSYTELLAQKYQGKLDPDADKYIQYIVDGTSQMHMLINDLLAYSRVGTRSKSFAPLKLDSVLDQALQSLSHSITKSGLNIQREQLPEVNGDHVQLAQLFQNLISNVIKFRKKDVPPHVRISVALQEEMWIIGVHDNGIGIEPRFFDSIFQIFRRLHTRQEYEGSGMGLAICRKIVEHHGGQIRVEAVVGEGSTFYFTLPARGGSHGD